MGDSAFLRAPMATLSTLVVFTLLVVAPAPTSGQTGGTLRVGVAASLTGEFSEWSEAVNGYQLWASMVNAAGGLAVSDNSTTWRLAINVTVRDDGSTAQGHAAAVDALLQQDGVHVVLGASPVFAVPESVAVQRAGRLNLHCCTAAAEVFSRDQSNVFGVAVDNAVYMQELYSQFRSANIFRLAVAYRSDVQELRTQCSGAIAQARTQLLTLSLDLPYMPANGSAAANSSTTAKSNTTDPLEVIVQKLMDSDAEALIFCGTGNESAAMAALIDRYRRPLKAIVFTNGAFTREWNQAVGPLAEAVVTVAQWAPDLTSRKDAFWGDSSAYTRQFLSTYGREPAYYAAAASASGLVLSTALSSAFAKCDVSTAARSNTTALLFGEGAIVCADNNNKGHLRLVASMELVNMDTFFGPVAFNRFGQNQASSPVVLQTYEVTEDLKTAFKPTLVLPLAAAKRPLLLPQQNRYAETCQPGTYQGPDQFVDCIPCDKGWFQEFAGRTNCEMCAKDSFANATGMPTCLACPANTVTLGRGSTNATECSCRPGFYQHQGLPGLPCEPCPPNAFCLGGSDLPAPLEGFYAEQEAPFTMYPCNPSSVCMGNFTCAPGYRGRMCYYCEEGYFRFLGNCVPCPSHSGNVIGYLVVVALLWVLINVAFARSVETLVIVINFCQFISIVVSFSLKWPGTLYRIMSICSILSFEMDSLEPTCLVPSWGFTHNLAVQLLLPLIMATLVALWCGITYGVFKLKMRRMTRSTRAANSIKLAHQSPWRQVLIGLLEGPADPRELRDVLLERAGIPLNFLSIGFLVLLKYNLSVFACVNINGVSYLQSAPNEQCYTPQHWKLMMLGTSGLIVYNIGYIILYANVLRQLLKFRALGDKRPLLMYGWIYEKYEAQYCWYESVILVQRICLVLVLLFIADPSLQALLGILVNVMVLLFGIRTAAYVDKQINGLQTSVDAVLGALLIAGLLFYNPLTGDGVARFMEIALMVVLLAVLGIAVISVVLSVVEAVMLMWLMSKHRPVAHNMGQRVRGYRHVYHVFGPIFLFNWLRRCSKEEWEDFHHLCMVLIDYVHPTSEVSYLSLKKVGRFWRYLLQNFPETIDFLASVEQQQRDHFNGFVEALYESFFDSSDEFRVQLFGIIKDKYKAPVAQWLSSCEDEDREFLQRVVRTAFTKAKGAQAGQDIVAAMSRSNTMGSTMTVLAAVHKFKQQTQDQSLSRATSTAGGDNPQDSNGADSPLTTNNSKFSHIAAWARRSAPAGNPNGDMSPIDYRPSGGTTSGPMSKLGSGHVSVSGVKPIVGAGSLKGAPSGELPAGGSSSGGSSGMAAAANAASTSLSKGLSSAFMRTSILEGDEGAELGAVDGGSGGGSSPTGGWGAPSTALGVAGTSPVTLLSPRAPKAAGPRRGSTVRWDDADGPGEGEGPGGREGDAEELLPVVGSDGARVGGVSPAAGEGKGEGGLGAGAMPGTPTEVEMGPIAAAAAGRSMRPLEVQLMQQLQPEGGVHSRKGGMMWEPLQVASPGSGVAAAAAAEEVLRLGEPAGAASATAGTGTGPDASDGFEALAPPTAAQDQQQQQQQQPSPRAKAEVPTDASGGVPVSQDWKPSTRWDEDADKLATTASALEPAAHVTPLGSTPAPPMASSFARRSAPPLPQSPQSQTPTLHQRPSLRISENLGDANAVTPIATWRGDGALSPASPRSGGAASPRLAAPPMAGQGGGSAVSPLILQLQRQTSAGRAGTPTRAGSAAAPVDPRVAVLRAHTPLRAHSPSGTRTASFMSGSMVRGAPALERGAAGGVQGQGATQQGGGGAGAGPQSDEALVEQELRELEVLE